MVREQKDGVTMETRATQAASYGLFGSFPCCSSSASLASAKWSNQSREESFSAAAAILIRKKVASGTPRKLKARRVGFFLGSVRAMRHHSTTEQVSKCGCCEIVTSDTMYYSLLFHFIPQGGTHGH